jgi:LysR family hydrogen peroxide-inducible transcriptional activator
MVSSGGGVTLIPSLAVDVEAKRAGLRVRALTSSSARRTIALVWRKGSAVEPLLRGVSAVIRDAYPQPVAERGQKHRAPAKR